MNDKEHEAGSTNSLRLHGPVPPSSIILRIILLILKLPVLFIGLALSLCCFNLGINYGPLADYKKIEHETEKESRISVKRGNE
jgi:hypothetical protein